MVLARVAVIALMFLASTRTTAADEATIRLLKVWIAAVQAHVPGEVDPPLGSISTLNREDLLRLRPFARALVGLVPDPRRTRVSRVQLPNADTAEVRFLAQTALAGRTANDFVKRAALLHTDVVLLVHSYPTLHPALQSRPRRREDQGGPLEVPLVIARGPDGRYEGTELGDLNWDYARDLLDAVTPLPAADDTVRLWYRSIGAGFASQYSFGEAWPHFQRAGKLLPDDPGVLFGEAAIHETLASPPIQDYVRTTKLPGQQRFMWVTAAQEHLDKAEQLLLRAIKFDPGFVDARLRLGRIVDQQGRHDAALAHFKQVLDTRPEATIAFYAHLFRGDAERALLQDDAARLSYEQALGLFPRAQSVRVALSHLARQRSDRAAALALLLPTLSASPVGRDQDDPWWDYHRGDGRNAEALLQQLRAPFLAGAKR